MKGTGAPVQLHISVRPSLETNDHEVVLLGDGQNLVDHFENKSIGVDPDQILVLPCPLLPEPGPHECLIGRCECGALGCGDVLAEISSDGDHVMWSAPYGARSPVLFELKSYRAEIERVMADHSWETPERTVSRLIRTGVDHARLGLSGLTFSWASGRAEPGSITVALWLAPGPYQLLVRVPWNGDEETAAFANSVIALLGRSPSSWPIVEWLPQEKNLAAPTIAGPGWRAWRSRLVD